MNSEIRLATLADIPILEALIEESVMLLQNKDYSEDQRKGALGIVFGVDSQLIKDGTYFAFEEDGRIVACGGWSRRRTLFGSDSIVGKNDQELDPLKDAARIRAFFIKPGWERRGIGSRILAKCEEEALLRGFNRFELVATPAGERLYGTKGYVVERRYEAPLPNGLTLPVIAMSKAG